MKLLLFISFLVLSSCSFQHNVTVTLVVPEYHPFEIAADSEFWYTLTYFDGRTINERHIPKGTRTLNVRVKAGGLSVFSLKPLGEFGSLGGFYEPGESREVHMLSENGSFSDMLLSAASYRPDAVRRLSMVKVMEEVDDLQSIDEPSFLEDVFNGTLGYGITCGCLNDMMFLPSRCRSAPVLCIFCYILGCIVMRNSISLFSSL